MSPDDILAANLWPWPDPLLKRDQAGNVLFVNAAFLQLYGGRIEDWNGRGVSGWPAPSPNGAQRFETRAGQAPNETTYDWVEMIMADGNSMAIARNVTALISKPTPPADKDPITIPQAESAAIAPPAFTQPAAVPVPQAQPEPALQTPPPATKPAPETPSVSFEETLDNDAKDYSYTAETPAQHTTQEHEPAPGVETSRMIERRALPIENSASLLGSNWRDEVIAKALGEETSPPKPDNTTRVAANITPDIEPEIKTPEAPHQSGSGLNILLAEDNAINALLTRTLLEAEGATVETVEDGALAVAAVQNNTYDMIFMDMRMPNMDGLESTRKIRALGAKMPIVALTANAFDDDRNSCFDSGMNDFMTKPVSAEELIEMVSTWTQKKDDEKIAS